MEFQLILCFEIVCKECRNYCLPLPQKCVFMRPQSSQIITKWKMGGSPGFLLTFEIGYFNVYISKMFHWLRNSRAAAGEKPGPLLCGEKPSRLSLRLGTHYTIYQHCVCHVFVATCKKEVFFSPILVHKGSKRKIFTVWLQPKYLMCRAAHCVQWRRPH